MSSTCERCGGTAETRPVTFRENVGLGILRLESVAQGSFCFPCERETFWHLTLVTLVAGWWGLSSVVIAPWVLFQNVRAYFSGRKRAAPSHRPNLRGSLLGRNGRVLAIALVVGVGLWRVFRYAFGLHIDFGLQVDWILFVAPVVLTVVAGASNLKRELGWALIALVLGFLVLAGIPLHLTTWSCLGYWLVVALVVEATHAWSPEWALRELRSLISLAVMLWLLLVYAYFQLGETVRFFWMCIDGRY